MNWLRDLPSEINEQLGGHYQSFVIGPDGAFHACRHCDYKQPQTDEGWATLREHEFGEHERPTLYDYRDLDGLTVTIGAVQRLDPTYGQPERLKVELFARTSDGTVYFLPTQDAYSWDDEGVPRGWKWKPKGQSERLLMAGPR